MKPITTDPASLNTSRKILRSPWMIGSIFGLSIAVAWIGGGFDAFYYFFTDTLWSVPPWVHVFLKPIALIPWPYSYVLLTVLTLLVLVFVKIFIGGSWGFVLFSAPVFWEIWSGQIDWMVALGILIAILILKGRMRPFWFGIVWVLMLSKPWVGIFAAIALTWLAYRQFGWKQMRFAFAVTGGIILLTFIYNPAWYLRGEVLQPFFLASTHTAYATNGALWPFGMIAWILVPGTKSQPALLRRILAATLLTSPFLHLYHAVVLTAFIENKKIDLAMLIIGWSIVATGIFQFNWSSLSWIYPLAFLLLDWGYEKYSQISKKRIDAPVPAP